MKNEFEKLFDSLEELEKGIDSLEKGVQALVQRQEAIDQRLIGLEQMFSRLGKSPASKSTLSEETIVQLYGEGVSVKEIAERASLGIHGVYAVLRKYK